MNGPGGGGPADIMLRRKLELKAENEVASSKAQSRTARDRQKYHWTNRPIRKIIAILLWNTCIACKRSKALDICKSEVLRSGFSI